MYSDQIGKTSNAMGLLIRRKIHTTSPTQLNPSHFIKVKKPYLPTTGIELFLTKHIIFETEQHRSHRQRATFKETIDGV